MRPLFMGKSASALSVLFCLTSLLLGAGRSKASVIEIQQVESAGGIEAWLVEDHSIPLITMRFAFKGGWASETPGKQGVSNFLAGMLDEGAGDRPSKEFQKRQQKLAMKMSYRAGADHFYGTFQALSKNRDKSVALLTDAINAPRFDEIPAERIRKQIILNIDSDAQDPHHIAITHWFKSILGDHPYARARRGIAKTINKLGPTDLHSLTKHLFRKSGLKIAVVGDIDASELGTVLDKVFGKLELQAGMPEVAEAIANSVTQVHIIETDIPQSVIQFGHGGIMRHDPDFIAAYVLNFILGGGGFGSRLTEEIREKRGLTYSVYSYLSLFDHGAFFLGGASTRNARAGETVTLIRKEMSRMAEQGPTKKELEEAKAYLTGSYALRFDTSNKIAGQLLAIQLEELGVDYVEKRNGLINAVTLDDLKRVAKRLLRPGELIVTIVGRPQGVTGVSSHGD